MFELTEKLTNEPTKTVETFKMEKTSILASISHQWTIEHCSQLFAFQPVRGSICSRQFQGENDEESFFLCFYLEETEDKENKATFGVSLNFDCSTETEDVVYKEVQFRLSLIRVDGTATRLMG